MGSGPGKGTDTCSELQAILQHCVYNIVQLKLTAVFTADPTIEPQKEFPVWNPFILATTKPQKSVQCVPGMGGLSDVRLPQYSLKFPSKGFIILPTDCGIYIYLYLAHMWFCLVP